MPCILDPDPAWGCASLHKLGIARGVLDAIASGDDADEEALDWPSFYESVKRQAREAFDSTGQPEGCPAQRPDYAVKSPQGTAAEYPINERKAKVLEQLCQMRARVHNELVPGFDTPCDCICVGKKLYSFQDDGTALAFMEEAISTALAARHRTETATTEETP